MGVLIPSLSIGMPVYNSADTLPNAINSLLTQSYSDFELIISDNCSDDATEAICRAFAGQDPRIRYFRQDQNLGMDHNFLFVLDQSRSEYFMWAGSDDIWSKNWLETLLSISQQNECLAIGRNQHLNLDGTISAHIANNFDITFTGPVMLRRLKYFIAPSIRGASNAIFGVFPRKVLISNSISKFSYHSGDQFYLYDLLSTIEIRSCADTFKYVRLHTNQSPVVRRTFLFRFRYLVTLLPNIFTSVIRSINFQNYWRVSSCSERIAIVLLFPIAFTRTSSIILKFELLKSR